MARKQAYIGDLAQGVPAICQALEKAGITPAGLPVHLSLGRDDLGAALATALAAFSATVLTEENETEKRKLLAFYDAEEKKRDAARAAASDAADKAAKAAGAGGRSFADLADKLSAIGAKLEVALENISTDFAAATASAVARIDELDDVKGAAARAAFLSALGASPRDRIRDGNGGRLDMTGVWEFYPGRINGGQLYYNHDTGLWYYRPSGSEAGYLIGQHTTHSRTMGVKITERFFALGREYPKDPVARFTAAHAGPFKNGLGVGKADDQHPTGQYARKLEELPAWAVRAASARDKAGKVKAK